jgi:hypothetical protein
VVYLKSKQGFILRKKTVKYIVNYLPLTVFDALERASILLVILAQAVVRLTKELKHLRIEE